MCVPAGAAHADAHSIPRKHCSPRVPRMPLIRCYFRARAALCTQVHASDAARAGRWRRRGGAEGVGSRRTRARDGVAAAPPAEQPPDRKPDDAATSAAAQVARPRGVSRHRRE